MKLKVAACQILTFPSPEESAVKITEWIKRASSEGVDVIAFPEASLCGYNCDLKYWENADPDRFKAAEDAITKTSADLGISVILGTPRWEQEQILNSLLVIDKGSVLGYYDKTHLAEVWPVPGKKLPVYNLAGVESCFIICHDIRYPELVRLPVIAGARICYYSSNEASLVKEFKLSAYRAMPVSRAAENDVFLVMTNAPGDPSNMHSKSQSHGNSKIIDPQGNIICEAGYFEETLVIAEIDVNRAEGIYALRALNDDSILAEWISKGVEIVDKG